MEVVQIILQVMQAVSALLLAAFVLLHSPKGEGVGAIGGASHLFASQKGAEATLNKITAYVAGVFFLVSFLLGYYF